MISSYTISTSIPRVDELSTDPRILGRHKASLGNYDNQLINYRYQEINNNQDMRGHQVFNK